MTPEEQAAKDRMAKIADEKWNKITPNDFKSFSNYLVSKALLENKVDVLGMECCYILAWMLEIGCRNKNKQVFSEESRRKILHDVLGMVMEEILGRMNFPDLGIKFPNEFDVVMKWDGE